MRLKKLTQTQRIAALEKTVFQLYAMDKMMQDELKSIQTQLKSIQEQLNPKQNEVKKK